MLRGLYQATSAMVTARAKQELIAANISNVETPGYKRQAVADEAFSSMMLLAQMGASQRQIGDSMVKSGISEPITDFSEGQLMESSSPYHLALYGKGFFAVQGEEGEEGIRYTRSGNFHIDGAGFVIDSYGNRLLLNNWQPVQTMGQKFEVARDGTVTVGGQPRGRLMMVDFENPVALRRDINGQFIDEAGEATPAASSVLQGYLERANVDIGEELIHMLLVNRIFESAQQIVSTYDQVMDKAKEIGSVR